MKILIIDNSTSFLPQLKNLLSNYSFQVIKSFEINNINKDDFDIIILSGGHNFPIKGNEEKLKEEINLIKNFNKPIFGICFGFEMIAYAFGAELELMENKERGVIDIEVIEQDEIFLNIPNFQVFESHRWIVKNPTEEMVVLAKSKNGIEAIKHKSKPIYGVQFHPEMFVEKTCGDEIFYNFINLIEQSYEK